MTLFEQARRAVASIPEPSTSELERRRALELELWFPLRQADSKASVEVFSTAHRDRPGLVVIEFRGDKHYFTEAEARSFVQRLQGGRS